MQLKVYFFIKILIKIESNLIKLLSINPVIHNIKIFEYAKKHCKVLLENIHINKYNNIINGLYFMLFLHFINIIELFIIKTSIRI